ncbi:MAG TPA: TolC family protein, partial [Planctomycetota bacterium]
MNRRATLVLLSLSLGCSAASPRPAVAPRAVPAPAPTPQAAVLDGPSQPDSAVDGRLSLKAALRSAQAHSPELAAAALELQAQAELQNVAGRLPDPEFSVGVEGLPFSTPRSGEEFLAGISQPIPLNGRLAGQEDLANARLQALQVRRDRIAGQVEVQLRGAFATALSLQEAAEVQASRVASAQFAEELAAARVQAGDLTPDALGSILADRVQLARELRDLRARSAAARSELFAMMGSRESAADLEASLDQVLELPAFEALADRIEAIPAVTEAMAQARVAELAADLAAAQTVPLVNLDLFYRQRGDERDSFDLGLHFEVPLSGTTAAE